MPDGRRIEYTSDPLGRRIAKSINGKAVEKYLWKDLTTLIAVTDGEGLHPKVFSYNEEGDPVSMTFEGRTFFFATNQVGTIFMVADERGYDVKRIIYDSFGNVLLDSGVSLDVCLGFAAGLTDKDTGLVHLGYREYDPAIGRFITPDPIGLAGGDVDVYGYCLDDPINFHDRTGLTGESEEKKEGAFSKIISGLRKASTAIPKGLEGATEKSIKGIKKATVEGGKAAVEALDKGADAAGEAVGKTVDEFKNNKELRKYTEIALGAGALPIALASGVAAGPAVSSAAASVATKIATTPGAQTVLGFAKGLNPFSGEAPKPSSLAEAAGMGTPLLIKTLDEMGVWNKIGDDFNKNVQNRYEGRYNIDKNKILPSRTTVTQRNSK
ncbi:RHS repeat-associated core domain-containing protein [Maridesulfovibrio ferrireducens]|uniref:RHS repeat-associated core domain-containing protein n=1 Tax=Maridesulfovibrio ferrireducens TaxID=246191 RepID=A0A1G9H5F4_9BACT|nr:RHS repeat-associated core domain-containing protein [Maridesulfovibrio ferrireducens]SDL07673.1 RHS repeat-associated core domain-containing protein [Maridesulfovibrio ferrireducens]